MAPNAYPYGGGGGMARADAGGGQRYCGRIKSFNPKQGFGFIECAEAHARFHRDVFLHKAQIGDLKVGAEVSFCVEQNKQGMPQARSVMTLDGNSPGPAPSDVAKGGGAGRRGGAGMGGKGRKGGGGSGPQGFKGGGGGGLRRDMPASVPM